MAPRLGQGHKKQEATVRATVKNTDPQTLRARDCRQRNTTEYLRSSSQGESLGEIKKIKSYHLYWELKSIHTGPGKTHTQKRA